MVLGLVKDKKVSAQHGTAPLGRQPQWRALQAFAVIAMLKPPPLGVRHAITQAVSTCAPQPRAGDPPRQWESNTPRGQTARRATAASGRARAAPTARACCPQPLRCRGAAGLA